MVTGRLTQGAAGGRQGGTGKDRYLAVRSFDLAHAAPFLELAWSRIRRDDPAPVLRVADRPEGRDIALGEVVQRSRIAGTSLSPREYGAVISWSIPHGRTLEDSLLAGPGVDVVPGPLPAVYALSDKRTTKALFDRFGIPTPRGVTIDRGFIEGGLLQAGFRRPLERQLLAGSRYPLIVKPSWDCLGHGTQIVSDPPQLDPALAGTDGRDLLVEEFLDGQAGTVEIIGEPGEYHIQPPCWSGPSAATWSGLEGIRIAHPNLFSGLLTSPLRTALQEVLAAVGFRGACCVDFVADDDSLTFLEINPRVSGASALSAVASGISAFEETCRIARKRWRTPRPHAQPGEAALQAGGEWADRLERILRERQIAVRWYRDAHLGVDGRDTRSIIVGADAPAMHAVIEGLGLIDLWPGLRSATDAVQASGR